MIAFRITSGTQEAGEPEEAEETLDYLPAFEAGKGALFPAELE